MGKTNIRNRSRIIRCMVLIPHQGELATTTVVCQVKYSDGSDEKSFNKRVSTYQHSSGDVLWFDAEVVRDDSVTLCVMCDRVPPLSCSIDSSNRVYVFISDNERAVKYMPGILASIDDFTSDPQWQALLDAVMRELYNIDGNTVETTNSIVLACLDVPGVCSSRILSQLYLYNRAPFVKSNDILRGYVRYIYHIMRDDSIRSRCAGDVDGVRSKIVHDIAYQQLDVPEAILIIQRPSRDINTVDIEPNLLTLYLFKLSQWSPSVLVDACVGDWRVLALAWVMNKSTSGLCVGHLDSVISWMLSMIPHFPQLTNRLHEFVSAAATGLTAALSCAQSPAALSSALIQTYKHVSMTLVDHVNIALSMSVVKSDYAIVVLNKLLEHEMGDIVERIRELRLQPEEFNVIIKDMDLKA